MTQKTYTITVQTAYNQEIKIIADSLDQAMNKILDPDAPLSLFLDPLYGSVRSIKAITSALPTRKGLK